MSIHRTAKGIVLVPTLLLGAAFIATAVWGGETAGDNRSLALTIGGILMGAGLLAQLLPEPEPENEASGESRGKSSGKTSSDQAP